MAERACTCVDHGPPSDPWRKPCTTPAKYRLVDEDGEGFLCNRHARAVRDMYEPGQIRKLRKPAAEKWPPVPRAEEPSDDMKVANRMADYAPRRDG